MRLAQSFAVAAAGEHQQFRALGRQVQRSLAMQGPSDLGRPRAVLGVVAIMSSLGIVKQGEHPYHLGIRPRSGRQREAMVHHSRPMRGAVDTLPFKPELSPDAMQQADRNHPKSRGMLYRLGWVMGMG
jgi:hypothetical protein